MLDTTNTKNPIEFHNVDFSINGKKLIDNASCQLTKTGKTVVMGANGAGKSLFLRLIAGLLQPDSGQLHVCTGNPSSTGDVCISMVFQNPILLRRTTFANVAYVLKQSGQSGQSGQGGHRKQAIAAKVDDALALAQLRDHAQTPARRLSGGEQQRLALARALVVCPDILLLDEATANLDPASTFIVENMVDEVSRTGTKIVFVTHDIRQTRRVADDILFIHQGRILAHKPTREFFRDPGSDQAQAYLDGRVPDQRVPD